MNHDTRDTMQSRSASGMGAGGIMISATSLIGEKVRNKSREDLGEIKDFMLDSGSGKIQYAVLSYGSFLGMGEKLFAVPYQALTLDTEDKCFILDVDKERLKDAPGFDKDNWPNMADQTWAQGVHKYYGSEHKPGNSAF